MLRMADPKRRAKRPSMKRKQIPTILPPTEGAQLAALGANARLAKGAASSLSTVAFRTRLDSPTRGQQDTSRKQHGDEGAPPTAVQLPCPPDDGGPTTAQHPRLESQRAQQDAP